MRLLGSTLVCAFFWLIVESGAASAQEPGRVYRIGWLNTGTPNSVIVPPEKWTEGWAAFRDALRDMGFVVGRNLVFEQRHAKGDLNQIASEAEALVALKVDVICAWQTPSIVAAMTATKTIPIVFRTGSPVERGIVKSLVNHGSNATGQTGDLSKPKMWQLLRDVAPSTQRAGHVAYAPNSFAQDRSPEFRARRMAVLSSQSAATGIELFDLMVDRLDELEPKVAALANGGNAALFLSIDPTLTSWRSEIMSMAMRYRLPTVCDQLFWSKHGCLIGYSEDPIEMFKRAAAQVVKIFNGTKPADIPIEQPTKFKIIVNAKTARALGLTMPTWLLVTADDVIE